MYSEFVMVKTSEKKKEQWKNHRENTHMIWVFSRALKDRHHLSQKKKKILEKLYSIRENGKQWVFNIRFQ